MCVTDLCPSPHGETSSESPPLAAYSGGADIYNRPEPLGNPARMTKFCGDPGGTGTAGRPAGDSLRGRPGRPRHPATPPSGAAPDPAPDPAGA